MSSLSSERSAQIDAIAARTGFSPEATASMSERIGAGGGRMAQFDHPEFGGAGQWMQGGMIMIGDLSNDPLKERIRQLCEALARLADEAPADASGVWRQGGMQLSGGTTSREEPHDGPDVGAARPSRAPGERHGPATWYPAELGRPDSSGTQDHTRYAWFASARRLALDDGRGVTVYDTGDHRIAGVSQQQGAHRSVMFTSQRGTVDVDRLPMIARHGRTGAVDDASTPSDPVTVTRSLSDSASKTPAAAPDSDNTGAGAGDPAMDPFASLEKLADLHRRGIVDDDEYRMKKTELLRRV